jgi:hypothetical protein
MPVDLEFVSVVAEWILINSTLKIHGLDKLLMSYHGIKLRRFKPIKSYCIKNKMGHCACL